MWKSCWLLPSIVPLCGALYLHEFDPLPSLPPSQTVADKPTSETRVGQGGEREDKEVNMRTESVRAAPTTLPRPYPPAGPPPGTPWDPSVPPPILLVGCHVSTPHIRSMLWCSTYASVALQWRQISG